MPAANHVLIAALLATVPTATPASAADEWLRLTTPHFELYTLSGDKNADKNPGEKKERDAILTFEQVRDQIMEATPTNWDQVLPARVISFQSEKQFKPYAPTGAVGSYSSSTQSRDYLVMVDSDPDHLPIAIHQEVHLVLDHARLKLPLWLIEGWADVLATPNALTKDHTDELKSVKWLDLNTLTSVTDKSPIYNENNRAGQFYAESWALVHMLYLGRDYRANFGKLLAALNDGNTAADAFQSAYGRSQSQIYTDLQAYIKQNSQNSGVLPKPKDAAIEPVLSSVSDLQSGVILADILAATNKREQAKAAYTKLAQQYPGAPEVAESLGYLALADGDNESALRYFEEALQGTKDPQMCYYLAKLYHDSGHRGDKLLATLTKAVALKPDYAEARLQLGIEEFNQGNYKDAIAALAPIQHIAPEHATVLRNVLAEAYAKTGDPASGLKQIEGEAQGLDCATAHPRLSVQASSASITFDLTDPKMIAVICGTASKFHVTAEYLAGELKAIQY